MAVSATFLILSDAAVPVAVDGVLVQVYDAAGDVFVTEGLTSGTGEAVLSLDGSVGGTSYVVRLSKDGWSFPPSNQFDASIFDPAGAAPDDNNFEYTAHEGMDGVIVTFSVMDDQVVPEAVEDVSIRVFSSADAFLTSGLTDSSGELGMVLEGEPDPGTEYIIRLYKQGLEFEDGATQRILVLDPVAAPETNVFDFTMHEAPAVPVSDDPDMCLLSGILVNASLLPARALTLRFIPKEAYPTLDASGLPYTSYPTIVRDQIISGESMVQTDENGYVQVALPRGSVFDVVIHGLESPGPNPLAEIVIPDVAGISLHDVLFPYVTRVTYGSDGTTVAVGDITEVDLTIVKSDLDSVTGADVGAFLLFTSSDETVALVNTTADGTMSVQGVAPGSATITVARLAGTNAPRRPAIDDLVVSPVPFNVTVT